VRAGVLVLFSVLAGCSYNRGSPESGGSSITLGPAPEQEEEEVERLDRTVPPDVGPPASMRIPEAAEFDLSNGLRVVMVEKHDVPMVNVVLQVRGGAAAVPEGKAGLAALTASLLDEGAGERSSLEIAEAIETLGARISSSAGRDAAVVRLGVVRPRFEEALEIFADVVTAPTFPDADVERVRTVQLTRILQGQSEPRVIADEALSRVLFGDGHPYGPPVMGSKDSVEQLTKEDVVAFYDAGYHTGNATLVVTGDVTREDLEPLLEEAFGAWASGAAPEVPAVEAPSLNQTTIYIVDKPDAAQSEVRVGRVAVDRATDDYFALTVLNTILGGSFTSRLNMKLREEKALTYGARSAFAMRRQPGPFVAGAAVHTPATDSAVVEFLNEIGRMAVEAVPDEELERAKNYVALRLPQGFETASDLAGRVSDLVLYDLPMDYYGGYVDQILETSAEDVLRAAQAWLTGGLAIVVAGDRGVIQAPLEALGIGPVVVLQPRDPSSAE